MKSIPVVRHLSDAELVDVVACLAQSGRDNTVELIVSLEELDRRQLFLPAGYRSLYMYCTRRLLLGEGAAYASIEAARASRRFPVILARLADGSITLATIGLIARHLTAANHLSLLEETRHKTKREVERIVARLKPKPDVPTVIRKVPARAAPGAAVAAAGGGAPAAGGAAVAVAGAAVGHGTTVGSAVSAEAELGAMHARVADAPLVWDAVADPIRSDGPPAQLVVVAPPPPRPIIAALTPERFKLQITMDRDTHDTLREIQDLIRHSVPSGDAAVIVARALKLLREQLLRQKAAQVRRPRTKPEDVAQPPPSRLIPAAVRRAVWDRDRGQCAFVGTDGRCTERGFLEFHHVEPFAAGGVSRARNIELRCRAHNDYEAQLFFGAGHARRRRA